MTPAQRKANRRHGAQKARANAQKMREIREAKKVSRGMDEGEEREDSA